MKLKNIKGLLPEKGNNDCLGEYVRNQFISEIGKKELCIDVEKVYEILVHINTDSIYKKAKAIAKAFPVKMVER